MSGFDERWLCLTTTLGGNSQFDHAATSRKGLATETGSKGLVVYVLISVHLLFNGGIAVIIIIISYIYIY